MDDFNHWLAKAMRYCAYQDRSIYEIKQKMNEWAVPENRQSALIEALISDRFLDENRFIEAFIRGKFFHLQWGKRKILQQLFYHQISASQVEPIWRQAIGEEDYRDVIEALILKKKKQWSALSPLLQKQKTIAFLQGKGYDYEDIIAVVNKK